MTVETSRSACELVLAEQMSGDIRNPFVMPTDVDAARRAQDAAQRGGQQQTGSRTIWETTDYSSSLRKTRKSIAAIEADVDPAALRRARESQGLLNAATAAISRDRRREKETLQEFIAKKRDMFMLSLTLDAKREEITQLEATAAAREKELDDAELKLEEDAVRFDSFLKTSDAAAHEAVRKAELRGKEKAENLHQLKSLKHQLAAMAAENAKLREVVDDYRKYAAFLEGLTPPEWTAAREAERAAAIEERRRAIFEDKLAAWTQKRDDKEAEMRAKVEVERAAMIKKGRKPTAVDIYALVRAALPPPPTLEGEPQPPLLESEEHLPMYFTDPEQLLQLFDSLEQSNLFLVTHSQDLEQALSELKQQHEETAAATARQSAALEAAMAELHAQIAAEVAKAAALRARVSGPAAVPAAASSVTSTAPTSTATGDDATTVESILPQLRGRVVEVYERCGFKATASSDTIGMLTQLEGKLEGLLASLATMDPQYLALKEKEKERERRARLREARMQAQQAAQEARQQKMLDRSQAPVKRRVGKPDMTRSLPFPKKEKEVEPDPQLLQELQDARFLS